MSRKANHETDRQTIAQFSEIINIGDAMSGDFVRLGIATPQALIGRDPLELYRQVCTVDKSFHDPCVLDVFMATIDFMNGNPPRLWWTFTAERKERFTSNVEALREEFGS